MSGSFSTTYKQICRRCFFLQDLRRRSMVPTLSFSTTRTKKGQEQDRLARTRVDEHQSARDYDREQGQQIGEEEQGEGREDERDVRRQRKRWCVHAVKHPRGRAIATARVGVRAGVGRIQGGGACSHALCRECVARRRRHEGREKKQDDKRGGSN
jgi:hypothetical protein